MRFIAPQNQKTLSGWGFDQTPLRELTMLPQHLVGTSLIAPSALRVNELPQFSASRRLCVLLCENCHMWLSFTLNTVYTLL